MCERWQLHCPGGMRVRDGLVWVRLPDSDLLPGKSPSMKTVQCVSGSTSLQHSYCGFFLDVYDLLIRSTDNAERNNRNNNRIHQNTQQRQQHGRRGYYVRPYCSSFWLTHHFPKPDRLTM